ncbi:MAG: Uma2 family endonuclease [Candidatus Latescibacteria bacterium]|nr:Uma2 family endonuclease [Candidatus Latescibacterota bacterium]
MNDDMETTPTIEVQREQQEWPAQGHWTYEDYRRLPDDGYRYEVIDGVLLMSPPPTPRHQDVCGELAFAMRVFVRHRQLGKVYEAPIEVVLPGIAAPVQPDIFFISTERLGIVGRTRIEEAPDLVVEILSPGNWLADRREKFRAYEMARVQEYWIVDPKQRTIEVYVLQEENYALAGRYGPGEVAQSELLKGFAVDVSEIMGEK